MDIFEEFPDLRAAKRQAGRGAKSWTPFPGKITPRTFPPRQATAPAGRQRVQWNYKHRRGRRQPFPPRPEDKSPSSIFTAESIPSSPRSDTVADGLVWHNRDTPLPGTLVVGRALSREDAKKFNVKRRQGSATLAIGKAVLLREQERWEVSVRLAEGLEQATQEVFGSGFVKLVSVMTEEYVD